jgi:hypothetical protein
MATEFSFNFIFDSIIREIEQFVPDPRRAKMFIGRLINCKAGMCRDYNAVKNDIKSKCMKFINGPLDRHKCAASFMIAFLNKLEVEESNLNKEFLAIYIGLNIVRILITEENRNYSECGILAFIQNGFKAPDCIRDIEPYWYNWALSIHYDRLSGRLSALALSNTLFWVERYNRTLAENIP